MTKTPKVAIFIDLPNIHKPLEEMGVPFDARPALARVREACGKVVLANAYAQFQAVPMDAQMHLLAQNVTPIQCPAYQNGTSNKKPTTDPVMMRAIYEMLYSSRRIDTFVIGSGDGDFAPVAAAIRARGRRVVALCVQKTLCRYLREAVDEVIFWPVPIRITISENASPLPGAPKLSPPSQTSSSAVDVKDLERLVEMERNGEDMSADRVRGQIPSLSDMLKRGLITLHNGKVQLCRNHPLVASACADGNGQAHHS